MPSIAFLSEGKVFVRTSAGAVQELSSEFAETARTRAARIAQRHAWKSSGRGARFMMGLGGAADAEELLEPSRGDAPDDVPRQPAGRRP